MKVFFLILFLTPHAHAFDVSLPCNPQTQCVVPLRGCDSVKNSLKFLISCVVKKKLRAYRRDWIDVDYSRLPGEDIRNLRDERCIAESKSTPPGSRFEGPVCDPLNPEERCGSKAGLVYQSASSLNQDTNALFLRRTGSGFQLGKATTRPVDQIEVIASNGKGVFENALMRGAWLKAVKCEEHQVLKDLDFLKIRNIELACQGFAKDAQQMTRDMNGLNEEIPEEIVPSLCTSEAKEAIPFCKTFDKDAPPELPENLVSACLVDNARTALDTGAMGYLGVCQIFSRAEKKYSAVFQTEKAIENFTAQVAAFVIAPCYLRSKEQCQGVSKRERESCINRNLNRCYQSTYPDFFKKIVSSRFPERGSCRSSPVDPVTRTSLSGTLKIKYVQHCFGKDQILINSEKQARLCCKGTERKVPYPSQCPQKAFSPGDFVLLGKKVVDGAKESIQNFKKHASEKAGFPAGEKE